MLYFYCATEEDLENIREHGIQTETHPIRLWQSLSDAQANCISDRILVIDGLALHGHALLEHQTNGERPTASRVPAETIQNLNPYITPKSVAAAGGYVLRNGPEGPEVLTIFRRGVWDLPKGKVEPSESPEEAALREVKEEVGIDQLRLLDAVGTTMHGYHRNQRFHVKTTYWYGMETSETTFTPQREEQIERVVWMPWSDAKIKIGYETLRQHMESIEATVWELVR